MTKLKTLKDLKVESSYFDMENDRIFNFIERENIKEEAIKWVKSVFVYNKETGEFTKTGTLNFMEFFNITEEDLE